MQGAAGVFLSMFAVVLTWAVIIGLLIVLPSGLSTKSLRVQSASDEFSQRGSAPRSDTAKQQFMKESG